MKKFIAWVLIFVLTACLAMPASAEGSYFDGYDRGFEDGYADAEAGKPSAVDDETHSYDQGYIDGYQEYEYKRGYNDGYADGKADAEAGKEERDDLPWYTGSVYDDGYYEGYFDGYYGLDDAYNYGDRIDDVLTDCGGTPGKINVRLDEKCLNFGAVWPENHNGRVMAPARAILKALGAEVDYDADTGTVIARKDGMLLHHVIGSEFLEIYPEGDTSKEPRRLEMGCASYVRGGRTMVPVRFFAEAFGLYVGWDGYYQTVVLVDTQALLASYADKLTVVNLLLSDTLNRYQSGGTYRQVAELSADVELLDSLNGNRRLDVGGKIESLFGEKGVNATVDLDLADVLALAVEEYESYLETYEQEMLELCKKLHLEVIYNASTGKLYVKSPVFDYMTGQEVWIEAGSPVQPLSGGPLLEQYMMQDVLNQQSWYYADPILAYDLARERLDELTEAFGDQNFRKSGSTYTLKTDSGLAEAIQEAVDDSFGVLGPLCELQFQLTDNGDGTCRYSGSLRYQSVDMALNADIRKNGGSETLTASVHVRNVCKADCKLTLQTVPSTDPIQTMPPTEPVDMDELYG